MDIVALLEELVNGLIAAEDKFFQNPKDFYLSQKENLLWLPEENADMITTLDKGAGQVRSNGKLAFVINKSNIAICYARFYLMYTIFNYCFRSIRKFNSRSSNTCIDVI